MGSKDVNDGRVVVCPTQAITNLFQELFDLCLLALLFCLVRISLKCIKVGLTST